MNKYIDFIGYLGIILYIGLNIVDHLTDVSDMIYSLICIIAIIMELPLMIKSIKELKRK